MGKIGIPTYDDQLNDLELNEMKKKITGICLDFAKIYSDESKEKRNSDIFDEYVEQFRVDLANLQQMNLYAQQLINQINDMMYTISVRKIDERIWEVTNEKIKEGSL